MRLVSGPSALSRCGHPIECIVQESPLGDSLTFLLPGLICHDEADLSHGRHSNLDINATTVPFKLDTTITRRNNCRLGSVRRHDARQEADTAPNGSRI